MDNRYKVPCLYAEFKEDVPSYMATEWTCLSDMTRTSASRCYKYIISEFHLATAVLWMAILVGLSACGRVAFHASMTIGHGVSSNWEMSRAHRDGNTFPAFNSSSREVGSQWAHLHQSLLVFCSVDVQRRSGFSLAKRSQGDSYCKLPAWSFMFYPFLHGFSLRYSGCFHPRSKHTDQARTLNSKVGVSANGCLSVLVSLRRRGLGSSYPVTLS